MKSEKLGDRLRRFRIERGLSIEEVAKRIEVSSSTYREWENGRAIRGEPYIKIRDLFGVTLEELLTGKKGKLSTAFEQVDVLEKQVIVLRSELLKLA